MSYPASSPNVPEILAGSEKRLAALTEARKLLVAGRATATQPTGFELVIVAQFLLDGTVPKQTTYEIRTDGVMAPAAGPPNITTW